MYFLIMFFQVPPILILLFKHFRRSDWVRKFILEKLSFIFVYGFQYSLLGISRLLVSVVTGHCTLNNHMKTMKLANALKRMKRWSTFSADAQSSLG
jgi:hypothetical protein